MAGKSHEHAHLEGQLSFIDAPEPTVPVADVDTDVEAAEQPAADASIITGPNTRIRASNAMHRARAGAVQGALLAIARHGIRGLTMVQAADLGGLARATLYNHVRDKEQLLELLLDHETARVARTFVEAPDLATALTDAASMVAEHPSLAGVREHDKASLAPLASVTDAHVRRLAADSLAARGCNASDANVDLLLRWLGSFVAVPADAATRSAQAAALARTLG